MRTDVKVGLICAFAIVLGVVIYFVSQGSSTKPPLKTAGTTGPSTPAILRNSDSTATAPDALLGSAGNSGSVSGPVIGPPGGSTASAPTLGGVTTPSMGGTTSAPSLVTGPTPAPLPEIITHPDVATHPSIDISTAPPLGFGGLGTIPTTPTTGATTYKIQKGDMLGTIAHKFDVTVKAIQDANPGVDSTRLKVDSTIRIPAPVAHSTSVASTRPTAPTSPRTGGSTTSVISATSAIHSGTTYKVKKGDSLATIAKAAYGTNAKSGVQKIFQANRSVMYDPDIVPLGAELKIP